MPISGCGNNKGDKYRVSIVCGHLPVGVEWVLRTRRCKRSLHCGLSPPLQLDFVSFRLISDRTFLLQHGIWETPNHPRCGSCLLIIRISQIFRSIFQWQGNPATTDWNARAASMIWDDCRPPDLRSSSQTTQVLLFFILH